MSLTDSHFELTARTDGVRFDLNADETEELISWTSGDSDEGFLALDRNLNGVIDDGTELFGDATPQPPSSEPNGYVALATWDDPVNGGNGDGIIDSGDDIFAALLIWLDSNHNGLSEPDELSSLDEMGLISVDLDYKESARTDKYGNSFRFKSKGHRDNGGVSITYDVFFTSDE